MLPLAPAVGLVPAAGVEGVEVVGEAAADGGLLHCWRRPRAAVRRGREVRRPTAKTDLSLTDAFLWIKTIGESDGSCKRGTPGPADPEYGTIDPAAGAWWPDMAHWLAKNAAPTLTLNPTCRHDAVGGGAPAGPAPPPGTAGGGGGRPRASRHRVMDRRSWRSTQE
ncbi:glycoside hydrolase family 6 protein [Catellatospora tritici]|uniref:glycoside hydrolase family 6 protein n=1 Tax=Catellatospora tritici TaxID=2851566 RepID=UPI0020C1C2DF|nr:glycoside hydrolase family 6 protein [Catellatospora tritici]